MAVVRIAVYGIIAVKDVVVKQLKYDFLDKNGTNKLLIVTPDEFLLREDRVEPIPSHGFTDTGNTNQYHQYYNRRDLFDRRLVERTLANPGNIKLLELSSKRVNSVGHNSAANQMDTLTFFPFQAVSMIEQFKAGGGINIDIHRRAGGLAAGHIACVPGFFGCIDMEKVFKDIKKIAEEYPSRSIVLQFEEVGLVYADLGVLIDKYFAEIIAQKRLFIRTQSVMDLGAIFNASRNGFVNEYNKFYSSSFPATTTDLQRYANSDFVVYGSQIMGDAVFAAEGCNISAANMPARVAETKAMYWEGALDDKIHGPANSNDIGFLTPASIRRHFECGGRRFEFDLVQTDCDKRILLVDLLSLQAMQNSLVNNTSPQLRDFQMEVDALISANMKVANNCNNGYPAPAGPTMFMVSNACYSFATSFSSRIIAHGAGVGAEKYGYSRETANNVVSVATNLTPCLVGLYCSGLTSLTGQLTSFAGSVSGRLVAYCCKKVALACLSEKKAKVVTDIIDNKIEPVVAFALSVAFPYAFISGMGVQSAVIMPFMLASSTIGTKAADLGVYGVGKVVKRVERFKAYRQTEIFPDDNDGVVEREDMQVIVPGSVPAATVAVVDYSNDERVPIISTPSPPAHQCGRPASALQSAFHRRSCSDMQPAEAADEVQPSFQQRRMFSVPSSHRHHLRNISGEVLSISPGMQTPPSHVEVERHRRAHGRSVSFLEISPLQTEVVFPPSSSSNLDHHSRPGSINQVRVASDTSPSAQATASEIGIRGHVRTDSYVSNTSPTSDRNVERW